MPAARFKAGDRVFLRVPEDVKRMSGAFEVVRVLPFERSSGHQYRVRRVPAGEERVVAENQLEAITGA